jgi:AcrR family transcriptional regulator
MRARKAATRNPDETRAALLVAGEREFNTRGFHGTDTNRIARIAGYAPQTFYRHFTDKTEIFVAVYERWWQSEADAVRRVFDARGNFDALKLADTLIAFHVKWRGFRRSLRHLAVEDARVRTARTKARKAQIATTRALRPGLKRGDAQIYATLLTLERLCDAIADSEFADMGVIKSAAREAVADAVAAML